MILSLMIYVLAVTALAAAAAWALERALGERGLPTRWVWVVAMAGAVVAAVAALPRQHVTVTIDPEPGAFPIEAIEMSFPVPETAAVAAGDAATRTRLAVPNTFDPLLVGLWLALSVAMVGGLVRGWVALERERRGWRPANLDGYGVLLSERRGPAVVGVANPEIVVPRWLPKLSESDRTLLLEHEREHVVSGDSRLLAGALALLALMPWNAPLWWIVVRLRQALEIDCDRRVLKESPGIRRYASLLIDVGERTRMPRFAVLAFASPALFLERRIRAMTDPKNPRAFRAMAFAVLGSLLIAGACYVEQFEVRLGDEGVEAVEAVEADPTAGEVFQAQELLTDLGVEVRGADLPPLRVTVAWDNGAVTGRVTDRATDIPVGSAQVFFPGLNLAGLTQGNGRFLLLNVPDGIHDFQVEHRAHRPYLATIQVPDVEELGLRAEFEDLRARYRELLTEKQLRDAQDAAERLRLDGAALVDRVGVLLRESLDADAERTIEELPRRFMDENWAAEGRKWDFSEGAAQRGPSTGTITGQVTNAEGQAVQSAQVYIESLNMGGLTNRQGRFLLLNVPAGEHQLTFSVAGAENRREDVSVNAGRTTTVAMSLAGVSRNPLFMVRRLEGTAVRQLDETETEQQLPEGSFSGLITDTDDNPIASAQVFFPGLQMGGLTNNRGRFLILNVPEGEHTLRIEAIGYEPREETLPFGAKTSVVSVFSLKAMAGGTGRAPAYPGS